MTSSLGSGGAETARRRRRERSLEKERRRHATKKMVVSLSLYLCFRSRVFLRNENGDDTKRDELVVVAR
jgi:hypothetical protein